MGEWSMVNGQCIIIPAAGASTRLGRVKQLVEFEGEPLIRRAVRISLEAVPNVIVVTGCEDAAVRQAFADLPALVADNPDWEKGMGKSLAVGVQAAIDRKPDLEAVLVHLCDLPMIDAEHLIHLCLRHSRTHADLIYTKYENTSGVPALFGRRYFEDLLFLDGDAGAKHLIKKDDDGRKDFVEFEGRFVDVDLPEDLGEFEDSV